MKALIALLSASWRYAEGYRIRLVLYAIMFVLANSILLIEPFVVGKILNTIQSIQSIENPLETLIPLFIALLGIQFLFWAFHGPARVIENLVAFHAANTFSQVLYSILTSLSVQWHKDHHSGQIINRMRKAHNALYNFMRDSFQGIEMVMRLCGSIIALAMIFPMAAFIAVGISIAAFTIVFLFDRVLLPQYEKINEHEHYLASAVHDYITNIFTVISLRLEKLTHNEVVRRMYVYLPLYRKNHMINEMKWFSSTMCIALMTVIVLFWYAHASIQGGEIILVGTVYMLYEYLQKLGGAFFTFAWKYSATIEQYADLRSADDILAAAPALKSKQKLSDDWKKIQISDVQFSYEDEEHQEHHIDSVSLELIRGKNIALVGESGSGKSTIMSLIRGLQVPENAVVRMDGVIVPDGFQSIAHHVTLIPQEPEIFSNTIEYNVSVDTEQAKQDILHDIEIACFRTVLDRLPKGLKTDVSEKGVNLSGGEKQRLALARGIFAARSSDIVLLDEPTSSVDSVNELQIHKNIFSEFKDKCIVASIHRLHLLHLFDYIYVMDNGRVIEEGSYNDLLSLNGRLASMMESYERESDSKSM